MILGFILFMLGSCIAALNFYLSFIEHLFCDRTKECRHASGFSLVGWVLLFWSFMIIHDWGWRKAIIAVALLDTGGLHWLVIMMLWNMVVTKDRAGRG